MTERPCYSPVTVIHAGLLKGKKHEYSRRTSMFTVEFDFDSVEIVVVDDSGFHEDLKVDSFDDIVYIRQWDEDKQEFNTITVNPEMWEELVEALSKSEGSYIKR